LHALLGDDPSLVPVKKLLTERTEGNPFFLEESVRTLVEATVLAGERGAYRLVKTPATVKMPATVQAILAARIDRLTAEDKRLLQSAAVIGKDVPFELLRAIVELPDEALRRGLDHLQAAEFLYETSVFPDLEYTFKHALTHEVAYGSLVQERRRTFHARIVLDEAAAICWTPRPPSTTTARRWRSPSRAACGPSSPTATSASASSTGARATASRPTSTSPPPRRCTARWTCGSGWSRRRRRCGTPPENRR
jgi:hypothetical protein